MSASCRDCPFYGFSFAAAGAVMMDTNGNQCALVTDSHSPCAMEMEGESPKWAECLLNDPSDKRITYFFDGGSKSVQVIYNGKLPASMGGDTLLFGSWFNLVMSGKV